MDPKTSREHTRLRELATEYRNLGYEVLIEPKPNQLPDFLQGIQPDMLATKEDESILFEVRSRSNLPGEPLQQFVTAIQNRPGWRFELVLTNPRESGQFGERPELLTDAQLREIARDSEKHLAKGHLQYSAMLAWITVEGAIASRLSGRISLQHLGHAPKKLIKEAVSLGLIEQEHFSRLELLAEFRNRFVHARQTTIPSESEIRRSLEVARMLLGRKAR